MRMNEPHIMRRTEPEVNLGGSIQEPCCVLEDALRDEPDRSIGPAAPSWGRTGGFLYRMY